MVSKLKKLSQEDLDDISDFFAGVVEKKIFSSVSSQKEILAMDVNINIDYNDENRELDIQCDVDIDTDELSKLSDERINQVIDDSYIELDEYIDQNYREWVHNFLSDFLCKNYCVILNFFHICVKKFS